MANRLVTWAKSQRVGEVAAKAVLLCLADAADADGVCWPSLATLSNYSEVPRRTLQRKLAMLAAGGWISIEARVRLSNAGQTSNRYRLLVSEEYVQHSAMSKKAEHARRVEAPKEPQAKMARGAVPSSGAPRHAKAGAPYEPSGLSSDCSEEQSDVASVEFEAVWRAWTKADPSYTRRAEAIDAWEDLRSSGVEPWQLREAMLALLRFHAQTRSKAPEWLHVTLKRGRGSWGHLLPTTKALEVQAEPIQTVFAGPPEIRASIVSSMGEKWTRSWFDPCGWGDEAVAVQARTRIGFDRIKQEVGSVLNRLGIELLPPMQASP